MAAIAGTSQTPCPVETALTQASTVVRQAITDIAIDNQQIERIVAEHVSTGLFSLMVHSEDHQTRRWKQRGPCVRLCSEIAWNWVTWEPAFKGFSLPKNHSDSVLSEL